MRRHDNQCGTAIQVVSEQRRLFCLKEADMRGRRRRQKDKDTDHRINRKGENT